MLRPRCKKAQFTEGIPALSGKCLEPQPEMIPGIRIVRLGDGCGGRRFQQFQRTPQRRKRLWPGGEHGFHLRAKAGEPGRSGAPRRERRSFCDDSQSIVQTVEKAIFNDFMIGKRQQSRLQGQHVACEISAVHRRHIERRQRFQSLRVVPVIEMSAVSLQPLDGAQRSRRAFEKRPAEI